MKEFGILTGAVFAWLLALGAGCGIPEEQHNRDIAALKQQMADAQKSCDAAKAQLTKEKDDLAGQKKSCDDSLAVALDQNHILETKVSSMGQNVQQLLGEKGELARERERLSSEIEELKRMRAAAEARNAEFRSLLEKLRKMIDAGTLQVKLRNGRMLVQMSSDVLFPPASIQLKKEAKAAITELAETLKTFPDRKFQVVGHSDSDPIRNERFPSNWELSTQRAVEVVKLMIQAGVPPEMINAAGSAEFDPLVPNDSPENKTMNRRVEIVFMPKIDELPGFDQVLSK